MGVSPINLLTLSGSAVTSPVPDHQILGEIFSRFFLAVPRLSGAFDELPVLFSNRMTDPASIRTGMSLRVEGQIRSYKKVIGGRSRLMLLAFAREIIFGVSEEDQANQVLLRGTLLKDPIHRMTPLGREIADMLLCVTRPHNKTDCLPCIAWGRSARFASTLAAGAAVKVKGRMQSRGYQKKLEDGSIEERMALEISIARLEYAGSSSASGHAAEFPVEGDR